MWRFLSRYMKQQPEPKGSGDGGQVVAAQSDGAEKSEVRPAVQNSRSKLAEITCTDLPALSPNPSTFANVSAELRTPLTLILAPLESLLLGEHGPITDRQTRLLMTVHRNAIKLLQMLTGLLDFSKLGSGSLNVYRQPVEAFALTSAIVGDFQDFAERKGVKLTIEHCEEPMLVMLDRYLYDRIVFNLISNAIKFTASRGHVKVSVSSYEDRLILKVTDTGIGIAKAEQSNIFKQFHHLDGASARRTEGIGLGLTLVREFARKLDGTVDVDSDLGQGSTFVVKILAPLQNPQHQFTGFQTDSHVHLLRQFESLGLPDPGQENAAGGTLPKVLIADNNVELTAYIADLLSRLCQTREASDGEQAQEQFYEWHPDLVITGATLPVKDGLSLCREIKKKPETAMTPVVLLTDLTERETMLKGWNAGADDYLFKPFHPAELIMRVRSLLHGAQQRLKAQEQIERLNETLEHRVIELAAANSELKSLATKLEQARDQALEASRFKSVFLANMSHEIRTPINGVISMSDMLTRTKLSAEQGEIANIIRDSAGSLLDIINDILDFSKIEAGKLDLEIVDFELPSVIEGTAELVAQQARDKRLSLMTYIAPDIPENLRGDPGRLRQILLNLLSNAIKFTDSGEVMVRVTLETLDEQRCCIRFSVSDTGIGMTPDTVRQLFQPFTQADGSITRKYGGTGLGLSIARLLVELLGGRIGVHSNESQGSKFWFSVPLERSKAAQAIPPAAPVELTATRVLVVDPAVGAGTIFTDYLESMGMSVCRVETAMQALKALNLDAAAGKPFAVALVSFVLPDMSSFVFAERVKSSNVISGTRLILCTAKDEPDLGESAMNAGFSAYLIKPVKKSRLLDCVALVLSRGQGLRDEQPASPTERLMTTGEFSVIQNVGMILVAEDNPVNQKVATLLLRELGFSAHVVADGNEAVEAESLAPYSLVLMDCQMPNMDGLQATGAIRRAETLTGRHVPIIAMTAHAMQGDREKCIAAGMDDYVSKPVTAAKLKEVLMRWFKPDSMQWRGARALPDQGAKTMSTPPSDGGSKQTAPETGESEAEGINLQALEAACGPEGALELLNIFVESTESLLVRMDGALGRKEAKELKSCAHEMKGACASVGATVMAKLSKNIEVSSLAEDWQESARLTQDLKNDFEGVRTCCKRILAQGVKTDAH